MAVIGFGVAEAETIDRIAAIVNDDVITLSEVYELGADYIEQRGAAGGPAARRDVEIEVLDSLIQRRLISQEIGRLGMDVTDVELDRTIDDIARRNGLEREDLQREVEASGLPWDQYREELEENLRQMKFSQGVIRPRITVDEDALVDAYQRRVASAELPAIMDLGAFFIVVEEDGESVSVEKAREAMVRVNNGESFETVASEVDEGPYGSRKGHMGTYKAGELMGELDAVAMQLSTGDTSEPVVTPQGVFVLHMFEKTTEAPVSFADVRDQLFEEVYAQAIQDETELWYRQARRRAAVLIKLEPSSTGL